MAVQSRIVLEPSAQAIVDATSQPPFLYELEPAAARKVLDDLQAAPVDKLPIEEEWITVPADVGDAKVRISRKAVQQEFNVIGCERHVGIEASDDVVFQSCNTGVTRFKSGHFGRETPLGFSRPLDEPNPWIPFRKTGDDCSGLIYGSVVHDNP